MSKKSEPLAPGVVPESRVLDARGTEIKPRDRVVFNQSGELAVGIVRSAKITRTRPTTYRPYYYNDYLIEIERTETASPRRGPSSYSGHVSKCRNPRGVLVLVLDDFPTR